MAHGNEKTCLRLRFCLTLSLSDILRGLSLSLGTSPHPSFPCPWFEPWRESPDSLQGGVGQKLPHPSYQTYLLARPRPVPCTAMDKLSPGSCNLLRRSKLTYLKADNETRPGHPRKPRAGQFDNRMLRGEDRRAWAAPGNALGDRKTVWLAPGRDLNIYFSSHLWLSSHSTCYSGLAAQTPLTGKWVHMVP